ncbi:hypothetical protein [Rhodopirellula sp. SWK7]|uniref:hypothetical protein n=1 Tax=Rhodopirellula sp. SWK7 TaxID=595460 RepID=UPI00118196D2|nr:hypothetical protein [Rhodopirellula sp. SWK7]
MPRIAEMTLDTARPGSERRSVCIALSLPEIDPKDSSGSTYRTLLEFGDFYKPMYIHGDGSLQSLGLALSMLRNLLEIHADGGWVLYYSGTDDTASPDLNLFGKALGP